jgi:Asp-tRNA(Asn)/Glu-tRNA(Gln) amidotransferase A subunit family amidase
MNVSRGNEHARRKFLAYFSGAGLTTTLFPGVLWARLQESGAESLNIGMMKETAALAGLQFTDEEYELMVDEVKKNFDHYHEMRQTHLDNSVPPPLYFNPAVPGMRFERTERALRVSEVRGVSRPANLEDVAFWPVTRLARLIETREVSALELTDMYLSRLERLNPVLNCVVTLTTDRAREQARQADEEIAAGRYRGPLHGIPWGAKDIISVRGYRTTWGAAPFENQVLDVDANVVQRLDAAGAVLVAKLTTGELAFGDQWFGGRTNNPWKPEEGSSGSSAGSGSATGGGLVGFAIGTDTGGSILSPAVRNGVVGLRPTFGRVSRYGVMAAGYTLDKIGPMTRMVEDNALVLHAIAGPDDRDLAVVAGVPFNWDGTASVRELRFGFFESAFEEADSPEGEATLAHARRSLDTLRSLGYDLKPVEIPRNRLSYFIEYVERSAGFDEFARTRQDTDLKRQRHRGELRASHLVPAVEYLQANRIRYLFMQEMASVMAELDVVVSPWRAINPLTSMTGHPVVTVPNGFEEDDTPTGISLMGRIYGEERLLLAAKTLQDATDYHHRHPSL